MKIAIIGYGKMGKTIERLAIEKGHEIVCRFEADDFSLLNDGHINGAEVAIEFTGPEPAAKNIKACINIGLPVVSGSTGWLNSKWEEICAYCKLKDGSFFYASNYSIGVNIFFEINQRLAQLMSAFPEYKTEIEEIHHVHKLDAPSGTAITLADGILKNYPNYREWALFSEDAEISSYQIPVISKRMDEVPGTHLVRYESIIDQLEISHKAKGREGFASGAILAAEWLLGKRGIYGMKDLLKL